MSVQLTENQKGISWWWNRCNLLRTEKYSNILKGWDSTVCIGIVIIDDNGSGDNSFLHLSFWCNDEADDDETDNDGDKRRGAIAYPFYINKGVIGDIINNNI